VVNEYIGRLISQKSATGFFQKSRVVLNLIF
jgi:hypothetical protein